MLIRFIKKDFGNFNTYILSELCVKYKKIFSYEHLLYNDKELNDHMENSLDYKDKDEGFRGHPKCNFCKTRYFDNDQLFQHCRESHEQCHICIKQKQEYNVYYRNYDDLVTYNFIFLGTAL